MRHKWGSKTNKKSKDSSSVGCVKCGCVRQYVGGIVTYFINDMVYDRIAPKCDERLLPNDNNDERSVATGIN